MDPLEPGRNDEISGISRRSISSILKAPRKSTRYPDPEQQENLVECPKPVEKRNSRRVSFAPADNVLIFSNEVKNASPVRRPLQDLITTTTTQNRVEITEDEIQQITGMETLLNAPLHGPHKREMVNFQTEDAFGEKTVIFSAEDVFMDMTHCQTINITNNAELLTDMSIQSNDVFPTKENNVFFDADNAAMGVTSKKTPPLPTSRSTGPMSDITSKSSTGTGVDPGFENFLAGLFKSSDPHSKPTEVTVAGISSEETQTAELVKENQAPSLVRPVMEGSVSATRTIDTPLYRSAKTKSVEAVPGDVSRSFASKEFFPHLDRTPQLKQQQQSSGYATSFTTKEKMNLKNTSRQRDMGALDRTIMFSAGDEFMDMTQSHTVNIASGSLAHMSLKQTVDNSPSQKEQQRDARVPGAPASRTDPGFQDFFTGLFKTKSKVPGHEIRFDAEDDRRDKTVRFSADDACMDVTQSHTVNIATHNLCAASGPLEDAETGLPKAKISMTASSKTDMKETEGRFDARDTTAMVTAEEAFMDVTQSHTVNIISDLGSHSRQNMDFFPGFGEKTIRFNVNDAAMEVTQSHTVNIICDLDLHSQQREQRAPPSREVVTSPVCDVFMDETRSYTVNIDTGFNLQPNQNVDFVPMTGKNTVGLTENHAATGRLVNTEVQLHQNDDGVPLSGEKTVRFTESDAAMDVTKSHTVNIASDVNFYPQQSVPCAASGEQTVRFGADDAAMDETHSHTVNIDTGLHLRSRQHLGRFPAFGEKTVRFSAKEADMDVTRSLTVNIASNLDVQPEPKRAASPPKETKLLNDTSMDVAQSCAVNTDTTSGIDSDVPHRDSDMIFSEETTGFPFSLEKREDEMCPAPFLSGDAEDAQGFLHQLGQQRLAVEVEEKKPVKAAVLACPAAGPDAAATEAQTDHILSTDEPPHCTSGGSCGTKWTCEEMTVHKEVSAALLTSDKTECEPRKQMSPKCHDYVDVAPTRKSKRLSFADLNAKIRRLSHMMSTAPDSTESCTAALLQPEQDVDRNTQGKVDPSLALGPAVVTDEDAKGDRSAAEPTTSVAAETPFKLKTKQLMSRLSMGGFKPRLPQRAKASDGMATPAGKPTKTLSANVTSQLSDFDTDVSDINDEELDSCEDISEALGNKSPCKDGLKLSPPENFNMDGSLEEGVFIGDLIPADDKKGLLPTDEDDVEDERGQRREAGFNTGPQSGLGGDISDVTSAPTTTTQTTDESSSSHTASLRCEATFESTFKQSLFESQLEDYASDMQRKFDDGTVTMSEFFKLFNIDFVIHNPRQSILPERLQSDTERTPLDSLKGRHIHHPKHRVYEANVLSLTEKVEGLKERMHDLDKPLRIVNKTLWEELSGYTEKELKSFGTKLKERNNFFRKTSKVLSHEMKEALYSDLVQANQAEQQILRATTEKADEMIRSLDGCICELEAELAQVVEKGSEDSPSLKSLQQEMNKVTEALADDDRQISELEAQMTENSKKLRRLKAEAENLENHITTVHMLSEWRSGDASDSCAVYTFLYDTFHLQLAYEDPSGKVADHGAEKKISHIAFHHHIDEKSQDYAHMVHRLLSQYTQGEPDWVKTYPTDRHVPKLLLDVGLVVGRCRLLGEELRLLKMWGGLRLDILHISCVDTLVHTVFSSLKNFRKFEVVFSVSLSDHHYVLHLHSFKNMIGDTTLQQVEDIVASVTPGKNLLTKTLKKIYENLPH